MANNWSQGGQLPHNKGSRSHDHKGPPPICFNCGNAGHFVIDCPRAKSSNSGGGPASADPNSSYAFNGNGQRPHWHNGHMSPLGGSATSYPPNPVTTRFNGPSQPVQYNNSPTSYGPPPAEPYQQYPQSAPPYPVSGQPWNAHQQYSPSAPPYAYGQNQQAPTGGYQAPAYNQYPPRNGIQQYNGPGYQYPQAQYNSPPNVGPYQQPPNPYPSRSASYSGPSPTQWNNTAHTSPYDTPAYSQPPGLRRSASIQKDYSGTPSYQQYQEQTTPQNGLDSSHHTPATTPASGANQNIPAKISQASPVTGASLPSIASASGGSSRASTPYGRGTSAIGSGPLAGGGATKSATPITQTSEELAKASTQKPLKKEAEEGELTEEDLQEEAFNWEFKKIFMEPAKSESVALAQPLSTTYDMTPVPLLDSRSKSSVSRYARVENLKEFMKPIRSTPQWSYLQEDPAFSDAEIEGPLIPLDEVPTWIAERQGYVIAIPEAPPIIRKRARSEGQENSDNQPGLEADSESRDEGKPNKRQKNDGKLDDSVIVDTGGSSMTGTPTLRRAGTPSFGAIEDDVWAPQPGEGVALTSVDPTEALLASLGVTGFPKPLRRESKEPNGQDKSDTLHDNMQPSSPQAEPFQNDISQGRSSFSNTVQNIPPQAQPHGSPTGPRQGFQTTSSRPSHGPLQRPPQHAPSYDNTQYNGQQPSNHYYDSNPVYAGPPQPNQHYGNHALPQYNNDAPSQPAPVYGMPQQYDHYGNAPQGAPPQQPSWGNSQYGPPQTQYNNGYPPQDGPPYGISQSGESPYGHPEVSHSYGGPPQNIPTQSHYQYGPPAPDHGSHYDRAPQNSQQFPQLHGQPQNSQPRQDSGYESTRGSYSNGPPKRSSQNDNLPEKSQKMHLDGAGDTPSPDKEKSTTNPDNVNETSETEMVESPLSPTSAEILGKLVQDSSKSSNKKKAGDETGRKKKRQPVVAEAYSRRW